MLCLIDLRLDFGMMLPSTTSKAKDFLTFFIGGRCWNEIKTDLHLQSLEWKAMFLF